MEHRKLFVRQFQKKIAQAPQFLKNAPVVINVSALADENIDFKKTEANCRRCWLTSRGN